jgi:hypothetical protein
MNLVTAAQKDAPQQAENLHSDDLLVCKNNMI